MYVFVFSAVQLGIEQRISNFELFFFFFFFLRDGLHFCVNVKVFWLLFVTLEMVHYFYVIEFCKGV